ncbi:hypothetical protein [Pedobacter jeongneungensis]|uniref:hypothetical protein n=1 Tax=Pedobacter jeongneungensis TaxID=947309 RepID=UPI000469536B|nr:hypothetical protein [Pedobacter jeongneungensis]
MAKQTLNTIKNWFKTGFKPTQQQFWDTWDSFWHKDQVIPASSIENLDARFEEKADEEAFEAHLNDPNAHNIGNLSIPAGPINTLTGSGTRANLFYNTVEQVLYIYDGAAWRSATATDLTQFYTKEEINVLLSGDSGPLEGKFIKASPVDAQLADIKITGSGTFGTTAYTQIQNASISLSTGAAGGSFNTTGFSFGGATGSFGLNPSSLNGSNNSGSFSVNSESVNLNSSGKLVTLTSSYLFINDGSTGKGFTFTPNKLIFRNSGNVSSRIDIDESLTESVIYKLPATSGTLALESYVDEVVNKKAIPITVSGTEEYVLPWDDERKVLFGAYGDFSVWLNGSLEQVPITFTTGEDGKPNEYRFTLSGIDALILIK